MVPPLRSGSLLLSHLTGRWPKNSSLSVAHPFDATNLRCCLRNRRPPPCLPGIEVFGPRARLPHSHQPRQWNQSPPSRRPTAWPHPRGRTAFFQNLLAASSRRCYKGRQSLRPGDGQAGGGGQEGRCLGPERPHPAPEGRRGGRQSR